MRPLLLLPFLLMLILPSQNPVATNGDSSVVVLSFKWTKSRQAIEKTESASGAPAPAVIQENKIIERNARAQIPAGARDPNEETVDGRSAAIEKSVQESRSPKTKAVD